MLIIYHCRNSTDSYLRKQILIWDVVDYFRVILTATFIDMIFIPETQKMEEMGT